MRRKSRPTTFLVRDINLPLSPLTSFSAGRTEIRANRTIQKQVSDLLEEAGSVGRTLNVGLNKLCQNNVLTLFIGNLQRPRKFR